MSKEDNKEEAPEQEQSIWRSLGGTLLYLLVIVLLSSGDQILWLIRILLVFPVVLVWLVLRL